MDHTLSNSTRIPPFFTYEMPINQNYFMKRPEKLRRSDNQRGTRIDRAKILLFQQGNQKRQNSINPQKS
jgi:hypothetical protein